MTYAEKLQSPEWQKKKTEIQIRDKFTCQCCGDTKTQLQVHHKDYIKGREPWDYPNDNFILLCKHCHEFITFQNDYDTDYRFYKTIYEDGSFSIVLVENNMLAIYNSHLKSLSILIQGDEVREIVHEIIDRWLQNDNTHFLKDKKF